MFFVDKQRQKQGISLCPRAEASIQHSKLVIVKSAQSDCFRSEIENISRGKFLPNNHPLTPLSPFLDESGVLRVGGRLKHSNLKHGEKFPIILPSKGTFTNLVLQHYHNRSRHQGRVVTMASIRSAGYFILKGSSTIRKFLNQCVTCRRLRAPFVEQLMADLPSDRLERAPPFTHCGMDVFGPYAISESRVTRANKSTKKCWGLLFTCLVSRAVHIEPLDSLNISTFKNAFRRFICIRGSPSTLRTDRGSNFIGAYNQENDCSANDIKDELLKQNIVWIFNPPRAPHFGGVYERKVGSVKRIITACMLQLGPRSLTRDELVTFFAEASYIMNETPLTSISSNPNDPFPITPACLLLQRETRDTAPLESFTKRDILAYGARRWRRVQHLADVFWNSWKTDYVHELSRRHKWLTPKRSLQIGDIVLLRDDTKKRNHWPLARVKTTKISADGHVCSVTVVVARSSTKEPRKEYVRPVSQLVLLIPNVIALQ